MLTKATFNSSICPSLRRTIQAQIRSSLIQSRNRHNNKTITTSASTPAKQRKTHTIPWLMTRKSCSSPLAANTMHPTIVICKSKMAGSKSSALMLQTIHQIQQRRKTLKRSWSLRRFTQTLSIASSSYYASCPNLKSLNSSMNFILTLSCPQIKSLRR